jgi:hypothetical protein
VAILKIVFGFAKHGFESPTLWLDGKYLNSGIDDLEDLASFYNNKYK